MVKTKIASIHTYATHPSIFAVARPIVFLPFLPEKKDRITMGRGGQKGTYTDCLLPVIVAPSEQLSGTVLNCVVLCCAA